MNNLQKFTLFSLSGAEIISKKTQECLVIPLKSWKENPPMF